VVNVRFNREPSAAPGADEGSSMFNFDKNDIMRGIELLVLVITGFLLIFFVVRPLLKAATGGAATPALASANGLPVTPLDTQLVGGVLPGQPQMLAGPSEMDQRLDIARIEGQVKASSIKKVADFVDTHPEESTAILRSWVHET